MKKIYNYLFPVFLSLFAVAACDEDNEEIVQMTYENPCAIVTGISPVRGYVDTEFTISGEDFGVRTDDVKVVIQRIRETGYQCCKTFFWISRYGYCF